MTAEAISEDILGGIPDGLRVPLIEEYNKLARHYREGRWEPAELNGGKFCEIVYSILKGHVDASFPQAPYKPGNMLDDCKKLERSTGFPRSIRIQIPRMLIALYEIRNNRNVGHVGADVDPNHMDAAVVFSMCQWILAELVRVFHDILPEEATRVVETLTERPVPLLWKVGERTRVLNPSLSAKDRMLALLYGSARPLAATEIVKSIEYKNSSQFRKSILIPAHKAGLLDFEPRSGMVVLSPRGSKYVEEQIDLTI